MTDHGRIPNADVGVKTVAHQDRRVGRHQTGDQVAALGRSRQHGARVLQFYLKVYECCRRREDDPAGIRIEVRLAHR